MIIITDRADEVAQWLDDNCPASTYTQHNRQLIVDLDDDDDTLFSIRWAGCFIQSASNHHWYDDEPIVRMMLDLQRNALARIKDNGPAQS